MRRPDLYCLCVALLICQEMTKAVEQAEIVRRQCQAVAQLAFRLVEVVQPGQQTGHVAVDRQILWAEVGDPRAAASASSCLCCCVRRWLSAACRPGLPKSSSIARRSSTSAWSI